MKTSTLPTAARHLTAELLSLLERLFVLAGLRRVMRRISRRRASHGRRFVAEELERHRQLFDDIGGRSLETQQRQAVVTDEDNTLVVAGAGSGKTLTIVGKVHYLVKARHIAPEAILPISFTAASAESLRQRIAMPGIRPMTFHAFGLSVVQAAEQRRPRIFDDSQLPELLAGWVRFLTSRANSTYRDLLADYLHLRSNGQAMDREQAAPFLSLCASVLPLVRASDGDVAAIRQLHRQASPRRQTRIQIGSKGRTRQALHQRTDQFLVLFTPLLSLYERHLRRHGLIDFHEMINRATAYIADGRYLCDFDHVIIDEFQDLSPDRYRLLRAIRQQRPSVKLFCVGDDWQSIYRFAGSDIGLFRDFNRYFGTTATAYIGTTYRFSQPMIGLSSAFITRNPNQKPKRLKAPPDRPATTCSVSRLGTKRDDTDALLAALEELESVHGMAAASEIYVIGRFNFDYQRIHEVPGRLEPVERGGPGFDYRSASGTNLELRFVTAHRAKGLEADFCIILNCNRGRHGFPASQPEEPVLSLLLSSADDFEHGEERRLFYVAMTRARRHTVFICDPERTSPFISEIESLMSPPSK